MHIYPKTDLGILLVGVADARGVLYFPSPDKAHPGIFFSAKTNAVVADQLFAAASEAIGEPLDGAAMDIIHDYSDMVTLDDGREAQLFLASVKPEHLAIRMVWETLPALLRKMKHNRSRLPYLRAFQAFAGGMQAKTKAIEFDDPDEL